MIITSSPISFFLRSKNIKLFPGLSVMANRGALPNGRIPMQTQ